MWHSQVYVDNEFLGAGEIGQVRVHERLLDPQSIAYFCPRCGDIWARIVVCDVAPRWYSYVSLCPRHGLGTIWLTFEKEHMAALPAEVLERELLLAMENPKWYEYSLRERGSNGTMQPIVAVAEDTELPLTAAEVAEAEQSLNAF